MWTRQHDEQSWQVPLEGLGNRSSRAEKEQMDIREERIDLRHREKSEEQRVVDHIRMLARSKL
jgi:hypothetical protein